MLGCKKMLLRGAREVRGGYPFVHAIVGLVRIWLAFELVLGCSFGIGTLGFEIRLLKFRKAVFGITCCVLLYCLVLEREICKILAPQIAMGIGVLDLI